jgi:hypothetical protein
LIDFESVRTPEAGRSSIHLLLGLRVWLLEHGRIETETVGHQNGQEKDPLELVSISHGATPQNGKTQNNRQELAGCVWPRIDKSFELDFFPTYDFQSAYYTGAVAQNFSFKPHRSDQLHLFIG